MISILKTDLKTTEAGASFNYTIKPQTHVRTYRYIRTNMEVFVFSKRGDTTRRGAILRVATGDTALRATSPCTRLL